MTEQVLLQLLLVATTAIAVVSDVRTNRIPNRLVWAAAALGLLLNALGGAAQLLAGLLGLALALGIAIVPFVLGWLGAGDVKFLGALGAIVGLPSVPRLLFYTAIAGGLLAIGSLVWRRRRGFAAFVSEAKTDLKALVLSQGRVLPSGVRSKVSGGAQTVPYGIAIGAGALFAVFFDPRGGWAGF